MALTTQQRVTKLAAEVQRLYEEQLDSPEAKKKRRIFRAKARPETPRSKLMIAYDLETTRIEVGTPRPLYITAYSLAPEFQISQPVSSIEHLGTLLQSQFLTPELSGCRFVAWNANKFDAYFIAAALLQLGSDYVIRPYLTKSKALRGMRVTLLENDKIGWEFLDGMSMTGITKPLKDFLKVFAPKYQKLDAPNFEAVDFDPENPQHVAYAFRDSEGLYHGMLAAEKIVVDKFQTPLQPTVGNLGIKVFQAHMPLNTDIIPLPKDCLKAVKNNLMRGGYCYCNKKYHGPVWKYDINQAYAAAMREAWLPAGRANHAGKPHIYSKVYMARVTASKPADKVPFYVRGPDGKADFCIGHIPDAWLCKSEIDQLKAEGWKIKIHEAWWWDDFFRMKAYVDKLEQLRHAGEGGAKGAQGEMVKAVGNNSYGKTVETLEGLEVVLAAECPEGYASYQDEEDIFKYLWYTLGEPDSRDYHQPHIGAFITAHVRMVLRRAILLNPDAWLYADTDGIMFSAPVALDIDSKEYGKWKIEAEGEVFRIITKKVYANEDASEKHAKGVNIKRLDMHDFEAWFNGLPPVQKQVQRQNFLDVMSGSHMFREHIKQGSRDGREVFCKIPQK
jgi:hypothetical protein